MFFEQTVLEWAVNFEFRSALRNLGGAGRSRPSHLACWAKA